MKPPFSEISPKLRGKKLLEAAKYQAAMNLQGHGEPLAPLRRWWTSKYQKSPHSPDFEQYTLFELVVEFFEDYYGDHKTEMYDLDLPFASHGDPMVDKWEKELRAGIVPNLMEDLPPEEAEKLIEWSKKAYKKKIERGTISSDFDGNIGKAHAEVEKLLKDSNSFKEEY